MGDARRFDLFAEFVATRFPAARDIRIADVAAGKGGLRAALYQRGIRNVESWDKRRHAAKRRQGYHNAHFLYQSAPRGYGLVLGMHPDEATDHIVCYAVKHRVPFVVCPCCVKPSATRIADWGYDGWLRHLLSLAHAGRFKTDVQYLRMKGRNAVIAGWPA